MFKLLLIIHRLVFHLVDRTQCNAAMSGTQSYTNAASNTMALIIGTLGSTGNQGTASGGPRIVVEIRLALLYALVRRKDRRMEGFCPRPCRFNLNQGKVGYLHVTCDLAIGQSSFQAGQALVMKYCKEVIFFRSLPLEAMFEA